MASVNQLLQMIRALEKRVEELEKKVSKKRGKK